MSDKHDFVGENTRAGVNNGMHWRDASGYFQYQLSNTDRRAKSLRITYFKGDVNRRFTININGEVLAEVALPVGSPASDFYTVDYPLSPSIQQADQLVLKFQAGSGSVAGGIYGVRLIAE